MVKFIWQSVKPIFFIITLGFITASLFAYDQYQTWQERELGRKLIKNLVLEGSCNQIVNANQKLDLEFAFKNNNQEQVLLRGIKIDKSLIGTDDKKFLDFVSSTPGFADSGDPKSQQVSYSLEQTIGGEDSEILTLGFKAATREEAKATSHTIVIYKGRFFFNFKPDMTIETLCEIQVRYAD